jgi:inner membrane protein
MEKQKVSFAEKYAAILKVASIGILILILLIPASMIQSLIREREMRQDEAINEINNIWGHEQTITGPILTIPYFEYYKNDKDELTKTTSYAHFLPQNLSIDANIDPEKRYRGIFEVVVYESQIHLSGNFSFPDISALNINNNDVNWDKAFFSIGIPDLRGIQDNITMQVNNENIDFNPGLDSRDIISSGIHAYINLNKEVAEYEFDVEIKLNGSGNLSFTPVGKETNVTVTSNWTDPSFNGSFLPDNREIKSDGFNATWKVLHLNRNYPQQWKNNNFNVQNSTFGVSLLLPVDTYQKSMRSAKYAVMFIALTFLIFFFIEILNKKRIHPIQYTLVGLALIIFYVLLLSLSEHIGFAYAYIIASIAIVSLVTYYSHSFFKEKKLTAIMFLLLIILYYYIYFILQLQDYALLMGSLGLFVVLAIVMYLSRKIDWDSIGIKSNNSKSLN